MKPFLTTFILLSTTTAGFAQIASPDGRYVVEYFDALPGESNVKFKDAQTGKVLRYGFSSGYEESSFQEVLWSPDSSFLALVSRGTKTTSDIQIFRFHGESVSDVSIPDYRLNILGRQHLVTGGRYHWVSGARWDGNKLSFRCRGNWKDSYANAPEHWYHFKVMLEVSPSSSPDRARLQSVDAFEPKEDQGEQDGAGEPATRAESDSEGGDKPQPEAEERFR